MQYRYRGSVCISIVLNTTSVTMTIVLYYSLEYIAMRMIRIINMLAPNDHINNINMEVITMCHTQ